MPTLSRALHYDDRFPAEPRCVAPARERIVEFGRTAGMDVPGLTDMAIAVSEALTNGVLHAYPGRAAGCMWVTAELSGDAVLVTITDDGCGIRARSDSPGLGLGLGIMSRLCRRLELGPGPAGVGTTVTMGFPLAAATG